MNDRVRQMETELQAWETELERWHTEEESASGDPQLRKEQQQMLDDLHEKRLQARRYLDDLRRSGNWTHLQPKMEQLWAEIRRSITTIKQWA